MNSATPTNLKKTILLSFLSIGIMFLLYGLTESGYFGDNPVGQGSNFNVPSIVPQPYAFAIWGLIYTGLVVFPIYQWFKRQEGNPLWKKVHVWLAINAVLNGLWLAMASLDWLVITVVIMLLMLVTLYQINNLLRTINMESGDLSYWPEKFVFSIYFAWITLATALNITAALVYYNWSGFGIGDIPWSIAILCVASLIAAITFWKYKDVAYAGVVIWAFIALVVKHIDKLPVLAYLSITVVAIFVLLIVLGIRTSTAA